MASRFLLYSMGVLLLISCKPKDQQHKTVFRYNESAGITSLDPAFARNQANLWAVNQLFNGLVQLNDQLEVEPCIAYRWEILDEGKTYLFHLRKDVYFHDHVRFKDGKGRRVTARDLVYSFNRILDPSLASPGAWVFQNVDNQHDGSAFKALDDSTFRIRLKSPFPPFLGLLSMQYCSVVPEEIVRHYQEDFRKNPVGTGPFRFQLWKEGVKLVLLKNEHYFEQENGQSLPFLDAVAISFIVDKQSVFLEFVKGKLDFLSGLDASYKDEVLSKRGTMHPKYRGRFQLRTQSYLNTEYIGFNVDPSLHPNSPLLIKEIRQAISYGFDRKKMMRFLRNNIGVPGIHGFVPPGLPAFDSSNTVGYHYDPERSRLLLAKAGYPLGKGLPPVTISTNASYLDLAIYIQQQLNELGFNILLDVHPPASMREMIAQGKLACFRGSWIADYPDAENYLSLFYSANAAPAGPNYTHFSKPAFDQLYRLAIKETDTEKRYQLYQRMDQLMMDEAPVVILYYDQVLRFYQNNVSGLGNNPMNLLTLKKVKKVN